jgi:thioredoxin 1
VASLVYAWYSFYVPTNDVDWAENMVSARELANDSDKNMLLFFTGEWCSPCRIMKREVFADKEVMKAINSQVVPLMIDVDDPNAEELLRHYKVGDTPITIFTDPQGKVLDYAVGKIGKNKFLEMLENLGVAGS